MLATARKSLFSNWEKLYADYSFPSARGPPSTGRPGSNRLTPVCYIAERASAPRVCSHAWHPSSAFPQCRAAQTLHEQPCLAFFHLHLLWHCGQRRLTGASRLNACIRNRHWADKRLAALSLLQQSCPAIRTVAVRDIMRFVLRFASFTSVTSFLVMS